MTETPPMTGDRRLAAYARQDGLRDTDLAVLRVSTRKLTPAQRRRLDAKAARLHGKEPKARGTAPSGGLAALTAMWDAKRKAAPRGDA